MAEGIIRDILILVAGLVGGYLTAVLGGLHAPWWANFLHHRKLLKTRKTRQQALRAFNRIKAFRAGNGDKYAYYILLATSATICAAIASNLSLTIIIVKDFPPAFPIAIPAIIALLAIMTMLLCLATIYETARQLERFDGYKTEFEARWGYVDTQ